MKVLWILPKWPDPEIDGATRAHMALLKNWPNDHPLDLVVFSSSEKSQTEIEALRTKIGFADLLVLPYSKVHKFLYVLSSLFYKTKIPSTALRFRASTARLLWRRWHYEKIQTQEKTWSHIVFDGLHPAALFTDKKLNWQFPTGSFICSRTHNLETELWTQATEAAPIWSRWIFKKESKRMNQFENSFYSKCHLIAPVSEVDTRKILSLNPNLNVRSAFIGREWEAPLPFQQDKGLLEILFIGRLDWPPNAQGLEWFLDNVWPQVYQKRNKKSVLHLIGGFASHRLTDKINNTNGLIFHGQVHEVDSFYGKVSLSIIPIFSGSGTRVKVIESAHFGRSFIATEKGIEGITLEPGVDYLAANTTQEWIENLCQLSTKSCEQLGISIYEKLKTSYNQKNIQGQFIKNLNSLT